MSQTQYLGTTKIGRLLWELSIPAMVGSAVMALYNLVDRLFIGKFCGTETMAGLTLTFPYMMVLSAFGVLFGVGSAALISISLGEKRQDEAEKYLGQAIALKLLFVVIPMTLLLFLDQSIQWFGGNSTSIPYAREYLKVVLWGNVFAHLSFGIGAFMRAEGNAKRSMYVMILGAGTNIVLDALFVITFKMGIQGAAWATNIAMFLSTLYAFYHYFTPQAHVHLHLRYIRFWKKRIGPALAIGLAPFFLHLIASAIQITYNHAFGFYSASPSDASVAIATSGIINGIVLFGLMPVFGLTQGMQPIIGYNYGAKAYHRVRETFKVAMLSATVICVISAAICLVFSEYLIAAFTKANAEQVRTLGPWALRIAVLALPLIGAPITATTYYQSIGRARVAIILSTLRQAIILIPLILILPFFWGDRAIWFAAPVSDCLSTAITMTVVAFEMRRLKSLQSPDL